MLVIYGENGNCHRIYPSKEHNIKNTLDGD